MLCGPPMLEFDPCTLGLARLKADDGTVLVLDVVLADVVVEDRLTATDECGGADEEWGGAICDGGVRLLSGDSGIPVNDGGPANRAIGPPPPGPNPAIECDNIGCPGWPTPATAACAG